jgi:NAD(P)H-hydrate epimerase
MVLTSSQMLTAEQALMAGGVSAESLMEEAAAGIWEVLQQFFPEPADKVVFDFSRNQEVPQPSFPRPGAAILYLGKGNNAGDALVLARHLHAAGWKLVARCVAGEREFKELPARHWQALEGKIEVVSDGAAFAQQRGTILIVDGIMGTGASNEALRGPYADAVQEMNALRRARHGFTVAIDLPTGIGSGGPTVEADLTVTIGYPKTVLLEDHAAAHVGRLAIAPLQQLTDVSGDASRRVLTSQQLLPTLPCRSFEFHKGLAGRVGVVAGSRGFLGAGALAASGALRGGAGLVTLYVKEDTYPLIAGLAPHEVMVKPVRDYSEVLRDPVDVIAMGPGLGSEHDDEVEALLSRASVPVVVDADALNMLARRGFDALKQNDHPRLLTPHPGEMARLAAHFPGWKAMNRSDLVLSFTKLFPQATLLLKGARTLIASTGQPLSFNSTGNPGMASGGMGDVLTGLCAALAAQGMHLFDAACLGAWLSGRAAERAIFHGPSSQESLAAGDVLHHLGGAFGDLKKLVY